MRRMFLKLAGPVLGGLLIAPSILLGAEQEQQGQMTEGAGFTLFDVESIKGFDESKVQKDPVCDRSKRPRIMKVEPDEVKPGDKVTIKGENFGTKECFHGVSFSAASKTDVKYNLVNESTIEATVPDMKNGMTFVVVVAGGGSAQSKGVLILNK